MNRCPLDKSHDITVLVHRDTQGRQVLQNGPTCHQITLAPRSTQIPMNSVVPDACQQGTSYVDECSHFIHTNARLPASIEEWLKEMDDIGFLSPYHDTIAGHFDS